MKTSLNLMTDEDRRQQFVHGSKRLWIRILSTSLALMVLVAAAQWWQGRATGSQLRLLQERYTPLQTLKDECIRMRTEINAMRDTQQLTLRLVDTRPTVTLLGAISAAAATTNGEVYVEQLDLQHAESTTAQRTALVIGKGKDHTSIARFTAALRESDLFADVTLSSSDTSDALEEQARSFRIECQL
jgi:hypothetical protein